MVGDQLKDIQVICLVLSLFILRRHGDTLSIIVNTGQNFDYVK